MTPAELLAEIERLEGVLTRISTKDADLIDVLVNNIPVILPTLRGVKAAREEAGRVKKEIARIGNMIDHGGLSASWASSELLTLFRSMIEPPQPLTALSSGRDGDEVSARKDGGAAE